jgi:hypothetical protein
VEGRCGIIERTLISFNIFNGFECDTLLMAIPDTILRLSEKYSFFRNVYINELDAKKYNETQLRADYLDSFFRAMGCAFPDITCVD